jgi:hypothetical protein
VRNVIKDSAVSLLLLLALFLVSVPSSISPPARAQIANGIQASNYNVSTTENVPVTINVLANDSCLISGLSCPDGTYVQSVTQPSTGVAVINPDNTVTYTPNNGFIGSDSFTYTASDTLNLFTGTGTVSVTVNPDSSTTTVSPNPASVTPGSPLTFAATVTDTSPSPSAPAGSIAWSDGGAGGSFSPTTCTLSALNNSQSQCSTTYTSPSTTGSATIIAAYSGDSSHSFSSGTSTLTFGAGASGGITVSANRIQASYWDPCFATTCSAGTGPGTTMYFVLYDSSGNVVQTGFADEHGYTFSGLNPSATYYVYPDDCNACHGSMHDVVFQRWGDGGTVRPIAATVGSSLDAWYSCTNNCA